MASHPNGSISVWDVPKQNQLRTLRGDTRRVECFQLDGLELISGGCDASIRRFHIIEGTCSNVVRNAHRGAITCLAHNGMVAVSGGADSIVNVWEADSLRFVRALRGHRAGITGLAMMGGEIVVTAEWGALFVWNVNSGVVLKTLREPNGGITCVAAVIPTAPRYRLSSSLLVGADSYTDIPRVVTGGTAGLLTTWNVTTGHREALIPGHRDDVLHIQVIEGRFLVSSSADGAMSAWNLDDGSFIHTFHQCEKDGDEVKSFHFHANRSVMAIRNVIKVFTR